MLKRVAQACKGLEVGNQYYNNLMFINKGKLIHEYVDLKFSVNELALGYETDTGTLADLLRSWGVKVRNSAEANKTVRMRKKNSKGLTRYFSNPKNRETLSDTMEVVMNQPEVTSRLSVAMKKRWSDPVKRDNIVRNWVKSSHVRPSELEEIMIEVIKDYDLPFRYNGNNGDVVVGGLCPDFVHNNLKVVILVDGEIYHKDFEREIRIDETYRVAGYGVIHFSGTELTTMDDLHIYMTVWTLVRRFEKQLNLVSSPQEAR